ncbi:MAG: carboxypeptidase regulatory-like domain-containing protein, partial [Actinobacteria bacterium]|nr:carboxypeptidase regulatory-like domain-containing protein [Actinomycetota bacterium]
LVVSGAGYARPTGVIEGVVINQSSGEPQPGASVTLIALSEGSEPLEKKVTSDERGRYRFEDLPTGEDRLYAIDVVHDEGLFSGTALSIPDDTEEVPVIDTRIRVWDTTTEASVILVARTNLFLSPGEGGLDAIESVTINNLSDRAYIGRGMAGAQGQAEGQNDDTAIPSFGFALPRRAADGGVEILDSTIEIPELVSTDFGFGITAAIPPGETRVTYSYRVPGSAGSYDLSRTAVYPVVQFSVHAPDGFDVRSNRLQPDGEVTVGGIDYTRWSSDAAVEAGDQIQMVGVQEATGASGTAAWIIGGVAAVVVLMAMGIGWSVKKRGRTQTKRGRQTRPELLAQIAELDVRHENGDLARNDWERERRALIERVSALRKDSVER